MLDDDIITCPSGLRGRIRGVRGAEFNVFTDQRAMRDGRAADQILQRCWHETLEPGPYRLGVNHALPWGDVLVGDRVATLLAIRVQTYGPTEELDLRCPNCRTKFVWELPLNELPIQPFPQSTIDQIASGKNEFRTTIRGTELGFKLMTGRDQRASQKSLRERGDTELFETVIRQRVIRVNGSTETAEIDRWFTSMGGVDFQELLFAMDSQDGGVQTAVDVYCPSCSYEWEIDLPLDLDRMFSPRKKRRDNVPRARAERSVDSSTGSNASATSESSESSD